MKINLKTAAVFGLAVLSGVLLLYTSQEVQKAESQLRSSRAELAQERDTIRVLMAEWAYLSAPSRIEALAGEYLDLSPEAAGHIAPSLTALRPDAAELLHRPASYIAPPPVHKPSGGH